MKQLGWLGELREDENGNGRGQFGKGLLRQVKALSLKQQSQVEELSAGE